MKSYFEKEGEEDMISNLHLMCGYEDNDYNKVFDSTTKFSPTDEIILFLLQE